jgi:V/A-type H+-transporting ATPase subunit I
MLRVTAFGHRSVLDETVERLQHAGAVQITADEELPRSAEVAVEDRRHQLEELMGRVDFVREFLGRFHESEQPFSSFISEKVRLTEHEFLRLEYDDEFDELYRECEQLSGRLAEIGRERERLRELRAALEPWMGLRLQISRWHGTERVVLFTGTIATGRAEAVRSELREAVTELSIQEVGTAGPRQAWVVMVIPESESDVRDVLARADFEEISFPDLHDYPQEEIARIDQSLTEYDTDEETARARAEELSASYRDAVALAEALRSRWRNETVREDFGSTSRTFVLSGWLPVSRREDLEAVFADLPEIDLEFADPTQDDSPPVLLENPAILRPFEVVTDLYGRPVYGDLDPTAALSVWFFFFFGICLGDVGYGLALVGIAWLIKHRLDVAEGVQRFMDLLMYGGIASAIVGVLGGSYFAIEVEKLPQVLQGLAVFDFIKDVQLLLPLSVGLGAVHVLWGVSLRAYRYWRDGDRTAAIMQEASSLLLWASIGAAFLLPPEARMPAFGAGLGLTALMKGDVLVPPYGPRSALGLLKGVYGVYDTAIGHLSDFLSYTRLVALGMASVLVGWVMNLIAGLFPTTGRLAVLGIVAAVFVLVAGHAVNLVISLLGAFVHPLRLQFVEFFSKFYEGGGTNYVPFGYETKSLILRREASQEEGG